MSKVSAAKKQHRSMRGKQVDMDLLRKRNELTPAVGNARINARGDELGAGGAIIKKREDVVAELAWIGAGDAIGRDLKHGNSLYRYVAPDDFGEPETSFTICTFWYIDALAAIGRMDEAREMFELLLKQRNHLGLLSEDLAFDSGEAWGNFPQTYSHVGLITAAMRLSRSWQEAS